LVIDQPDLISKKTFRRLVAAIFISMAYDFIYLFILRDGNAEDEADGGSERTVRYISLFACYISFFFRIIVALVFWKDSMDYQKIIRGSQGLSVSGKGVSQLSAEEKKQVQDEKRLQ
jgi:hypothetical protein